MYGNFSVKKGYFASFGMFLISIFIVSYFPGRIEDDIFGNILGLLLAALLLVSFISCLLMLSMTIYEHVQKNKATKLNR
ncbi:hypothetical protein A8L34_28105 [Bacillus sp. FJAT-27264]|nr:hypothetical protein A8L34_28105 [Bacillus sp. FJAT-27264]